MKKITIFIIGLIIPVFISLADSATASAQEYKCKYISSIDQCVPCQPSSGDYNSCAPNTNVCGGVNVCSSLGVTCPGPSTFGSSPTYNCSIQQCAPPNSCQLDSVCPASRQVSGFSCNHVGINRVCCSPSPTPSPTTAPALPADCTYLSLTGNGLCGPSHPFRCPNNGFICCTTSTACSNIPKPPVPISAQEPFCDQATRTEVFTPFGCLDITGANTIRALLGWSIGIAGGIAFLSIVYAGFLIVTSQGDPKKSQSGKEMITSSIAGLFLILAAVVVLNFIGLNILGLGNLGFDV